MIKLYTILDKNDFVSHCERLEICPENGVPELLTENFIKAKFDRKTKTFYEGASIASINEYRSAKNEELKSEYEKMIHELIYVHVQKNVMRGVPIPLEIMEQYDNLRAEYNKKINEL